MPVSAPRRFNLENTAPLPDERIVRGAAPTLAGIKTGSLLPCRYESQENLICQIRQLNCRLGGKGVRLLPLRMERGFALLYLYRPDRLRQDLASSEVRSVLAEAGYDDFRPQRCLPTLMRRLRRQESFPHEIGLFLSYPPEDVRGFIRYGGKNSKCAGCWKVYGDVEQSRRRFEHYHRCTELYCRALSMGVPLERLTVL